MTTPRALPWFTDLRALILLLVVVFLSRLPFLGAGYGLHWDAWGNARIAQEMFQTGEYKMIRVPGAPVYEVTIALLSWGGPWMLNGLSAVAGIACVGIFALLARRYGCRDWLLAAATFGFCNVLYVNSVTSKDFAFSCALVLLSTLLVAKNRPGAAGVVLGLAMGSRLTSGTMALPLALLLFQTSPDKDRVKRLIWFATSTTVVSLVVFIPAFLRYGFAFLTFYKPVYYPPLSIVAHRGTVEVWSALGCFGLLLAAIGTVVVWGRTSSVNNGSTREALAWSSIILLHGTLYAVFPDQAGYFLPAVPFTILLLARFSPRWLFRTFCVMVIAGVFVSWDHGVEAGPIFRDRSDRLGMIANVRNFYSYARTIPGQNVFVVGGYYHGLSLIAPESRNGNFVYLLTKKELDDYTQAGFTIYYLPAIRQFEYDVNGIDLAQYGAIDVYAFRQAQDKSKVLTAPANKKERP